MKKLLLLATGLLVMFGVQVAPALAGYQPTGTFAEQGYDAQPLHYQRIAVNQATHKVYLADVISDQVRVFDPTLDAATEETSFGAGDLTDPVGVAVDEDSGDIYVSDVNGIVRYAPDGTRDVGFAILGVTGPLAFDQGANVLVVADTATNIVRRFSTAGVAGATFDGTNGSTAFVGLQDVAVDSSGDVIVVDADGDPATGLATSRVERFSAGGAHQVTFGPVHAAATVTVDPGSDDIVISGGQDAYHTSLFPTVQFFDQATPGTPTASPALAASARFSTVRGMAFDGARLYAVADVGDSFQYNFGKVQVQVLQPAAAPSATTGDATPTELGARLTGTINPNGAATTWVFEYGTTTGYGKQFPTVPGTIAAGRDPVAVVKAVGGLQPGTTYHYRLVATTEGGTANGADKTFTTTTPSAPAADGTDPTRAYEVVSSSAKNGTIVNSNRTVQVAANGDGASYMAVGALQGSKAASWNTVFAATRAGSGAWASTGLDAPQTALVGVMDLTTYGSSDDLSHSVQMSRRALAPGAVEGHPNLYVVDNRSDTRVLVATSADEAFWGVTGIGAGLNFIVARTPDLSDFVFNNPVALTDDAVAGEQNMYHWDGTALHLVNHLPGGGTGGGGIVGGAAFANRGIISDDGKSVFFQSYNATGALYVRESSAVTVPISVSRRSGHVGELAQASFVASAQNGNIVYFTSSVALTDDATADPVNSFRELYRYDRSADVLTDLTVVTDPADSIASPVLGPGMLGMSADGSTVYFGSHAKLAPGATPNGQNIYMWRDGTTKFVADLLPGDVADESGATGGVGAGGVSPNGRYLAFQTASRPTGYDNSGPACPAGHTGRPDRVCDQVYVIDAQDDEVRCVTCVSGHAPAGISELRVARASVVQDDGTVFVDTPDALTPGDVNRAVDVYSWKDGVTRRISTGRDQSPSFFAGASADAKNAFFFTFERLSALDDDQEVDLYDARVGGVARPPVSESVPVCDGDRCQGAATSPPAVQATTSDRPGSGDAEPSLRPSLSVAALTSKQRAALAAGSAVSVKVKVNAPGKVTASARARVSGRQQTVASATATATKPGSVTLRLRLSQAARKQLAASRKLSVVLSVRLSGAAKARTSTIALTAKRQAKKRSSDAPGRSASAVAKRMGA